MKLRERSEELERKILASHASYSHKAVRQRPEEECPIRTAFQRDRDRIIHSKSFRRLKHKTQVYIAPEDHYRMRMTHSLEVAQISRTIARGLALNEDLVEAIALGHDVGHTPFGHAGEEALCQLVGHFHHNEQSLRVVDHLERNGQGLNLTGEVRDGILHHTGAEEPLTLEGGIVRRGDRVAYLCHDYDDGIRAGMLQPQDLPEFVKTHLGTKTSDMITVMVTDMIEQSQGKEKIGFSPTVQQAMDEFRAFMFARIYRASPLEEERQKGQYVIHNLFAFFLKHPEQLPLEFQEREAQWGRETTVVDYIAGLTDQYAIHLFERWFIPVRWGHGCGR